MRKTITHKALSMLLAMAMVLTSIPIFSATAYGDSASNYSKVVDANTMNGWTKYFDLNNLITANVGGVWTDKSVFSNADAFAGTGITMLDDSKNFLTVLSALAATKEIVGYSTLPTDTVLVLDLSNSMQGEEDQLVKAANAAIKKLQQINNNNRVGVVFYSSQQLSGTSAYDSSVVRVLPIGRYTEANGEFLVIKKSGSSSTIAVKDSVRIEGQSADPRLDNSMKVDNCTYIQAGLWEAMEMFLEMDTVVTGDNWQKDEARMPILVLMSDGAPTIGTSNYDNVGAANVGNGIDRNMTTGQGFLVQLTASYVINRIQNHYAEGGQAKSLFYTLGFNVSGTSTANQIARSVLNPDGSTLTDSLWATYSQLTTGKMMVSVINSRGSTTEVSISKSSYVTNKSYVDEYFSATDDGLTTAFDDIVEEIILQSRYYPTHLEGGNPDFAGYVEFTDTLGAYMEVKQINGVLLGNTLFDGHMMASKLYDTTEDGLGTINNPTVLGNEFIRSVKERLGITNTAEAQALVAKAVNAGQLSYTSRTEWSNYIGWYAKADGTFLGFWDENSNDPAPNGAAYQVKSYGLLGETSGSIKNSDMMYMSIEVYTDLATGMQTVSWKVPAALVPMITYKVALDGNNVDTATNVKLTVEDADNISPIRLVYETGLRADLNEFNIADITEQENVAADGHTREFWNNFYDISAASHDQHITATAEFTPNIENERFYFTFDSAVFKKVDNQYVLVGENESLDVNGEYYHRRYVFQQDKTTPQFFYEKMSQKSIEVAKQNGWQADFVTLDNMVTGAWVVPAGTPARELQMYDEQKAVNTTDSARMVFHPYITESNNMVYVRMNLGNNGKLSVIPETGIKISKTVDVYEEGTADTFKFAIEANLSGAYEAWITDLGKTPSGQPSSLVFANGYAEVELKKDQTLWITGIPAGTEYVVEEISDNGDYKVKSVHVNGQYTGNVATGTVAQFLIDDVEFVNTALGEGDLVITKQVVDNQGNVVNVAESVKFTMEITLKDSKGKAVSGTFQSSLGEIQVGQDGKFTVALSAGHSVVVRGIPEKTQFTVVETNVPAGFEFVEEDSSMTGIVDVDMGHRAVVVNKYSPVAVSGTDVKVLVSKEITGNRTEWVLGEQYTFVLERLAGANQGAVGTVVATKTNSDTDTVKTSLFTLSNEIFAEAGTYYYRVTEQVGNQGGVTYDRAERRFVVVVADADMDGDLEILSVRNEINTTVTGQWQVEATFTNGYAPEGQATVVINIDKQINGGHSLNGYQFALYDQDPLNSSEEVEIVRSGLTNAQGKTTISLTYAADRATMAGTTYTYYLAEINAGQKINNILYSQQVYRVDVVVMDNGDGTISADMTISGLPQGATNPVFVNQYVPSESDYVVISGEKTITNNRVLNANEFQFVLTAVTEGAPMPVGTVATNDAEGNFAFAPIEFGDQHKGNTYVYLVTESQDNKIGGFTYDTTVYQVTVIVTDNGETVTAKVAITNGASVVEDIVFHNVYDPTDVTVTLEGNKILTGKEMQDGEFQFQISAVTSGAPMPENAVVTNDAKGLILFGSTTYDRPGTYVYRVVELAGTDARYDYDKAEYIVTVTVTDDSQGKLSAKVTYVKNDMVASGIVFKNGFVPTAITYDVSTEFDVLKELVGRPLVKGEFQFKLLNVVTGQQVGSVVANDENGVVSFDKILLPEVGVYHFKATEIVGDEKCITYDMAAYHLRVEVVMATDGELKVQSTKLVKETLSKEMVDGLLTEVVQYVDVTEGGQIKFTNTYKVEATEIEISAIKELVGRDLVEGEFTFNLYDSEGNLIATSTNLADGVVPFDAIAVSEEGVYTYKVVEVAGNDETVKYDEREFKVVVNVVDMLDGTLSMEYIYSEGENEADAVIFINYYEAPEEPEVPELPEVTPEQTGTGNGMWIWMMAMLASGVSICVLGSKNRRSFLR